MEIVSSGSVLSTKAHKITNIKRETGFSFLESDSSPHGWSLGFWTDSYVVPGC